MAEVESSDFRPKLVFYTGPCPYLECYHQALTDYIYEDDPRAPGFLQEAKSTLIPTSDGIEYTIGVAGVEGNESGTYSLMLVSLFRFQLVGFWVCLLESFLITCPFVIFTCTDGDGMPSSSDQCCLR